MPSAIAVLVATVVQFIIGFIWYMPLFGKEWGRIHGFDVLAPEVQKEMQSKMMPLLVTQFVMNAITAFVLGIFIVNIPSWNPYGMAGFFWFGFVFPAQVSAVIFGGTKPEWVVKKIAVATFGSLACYLAVAAVLSMM
jgi:hypothetical protein